MVSILVSMLSRHDVAINVAILTIACLLDLGVLVRLAPTYRPRLALGLLCLYYGYAHDM